ncbi:nucleolar pre-ribosomal-associated protein 1 [Denticeps clupeoides]|uniref:nucleolar pre-ribosomal-associated protein 1 n=1 Tax=Denticeps clupeoides TaxID=299321 RepID=UPI0010A4491A|nr:nucleolar pre-ribosomal-associated protein 1 [Denticeps clupeoides]
MGKKRPSETPPGDAAGKKPKGGGTEEEFSGTLLKSMLREPISAVKGLQMFVSIAERLPCDGLYDVVEGYLKISLECTEILKLLEGESPSKTEAMLVLQSLEMILLRTASDLSHFSMVGTSIVRKVLSSHMKMLQTGLHSEDHRFVRRCLSMLTAMVSQGPESARDVFSQVHFSKSLSGLARRRDKMGKPDVRLAYVQFALSFLLSGDNTTIGQILETKDFLTDILSSGLKEDRVSVINQVLVTLQSKVVQNKGISKTQKVRFFTASVLSSLASLYRWNGTVDVNTDSCKEAASAQEAGKVIVRKLAHGFLTALCCSRKHGISFHDPSLGTAGRAGNIVLLQFLVGLKQATEDELVAELVIGVLKSCPDLLPRYFKESQYSFTPRLRSTWLDSVSLMRKIYEAQPEVSGAFQTPEFIPLPRLLSMVLVSSLPPACNKAFFTQGLNFANTVVQHKTLSMLSFVLRRACRNMEHCLEQSTWSSSDLYTPALMDEFVQLYREALSKVVPDVTIVVSLWQSLTKREKGEEAERLLGESEEGVPDEPEVILLKALILQVMCLYQKTVPHLISQSNFDFSKLLKGIVSEKGMKKEVPPVLQAQILQLALELPASKFSWFRVQVASEQDAAVSDLVGGEKSVFYLLLKMFVSSSSGHLRTSTRMLVLKVLKDSGVFEHTWKELDHWLHHLVCLQSPQQETVISFLDQVLVKLVSSPHTYMDKAASLVQEAAYLQANLIGQEGDAVSIPISHIDDVLDMVDVIVEGCEGDMDQLGPALDDELVLQTFPFSALVPAALEARNKLQHKAGEEQGVVFEYLSSVLCDVLHCQREPLPLCLALQHYDKEGGAPHPSAVRLRRYYSTWLPPQSGEVQSPATPAPSSPPSRFTAIMMDAYGQGPDSVLQESVRRDVDASLSRLELDEFPVAVSQVLLYIRTTVENLSTLPKGTGVNAVSGLMDILQALVLKLLDLEETTETSEAGGDELFLDVMPTPEVNKEQVLREVLRLVFRHPSLLPWFLALDLGVLPPHSLSPVLVKRLCGELGGATLGLLRSCAAALRSLDALDLVGGFLQAVRRALLAELEKAASGGGCPATPSLALQGLLALHGHMEDCALDEVVSALLLLPRECLVTAVADGDARRSKLSVYGGAALQVLTEHASEGGAFYLSQAHLRGVSTLLMSCRDAALQDFLLRALTAEPGSANLLPTDVLLHCVRTDRALPLASLLLQNSVAHRLTFELWCLDTDALASAAAQRPAFLSLLLAYLHAARRDDVATPTEVRGAVLKELENALLPPLWRSVLGGAAGDALAQQVDVLSSLIALSSSAVSVLQLIGDLPPVLQKPGGFERWALVDVLSAKLDQHPEELRSWRASLLSAALCCLVASYRSSRELDKAPLEQEEAVLRRLPGLMILPEDAAASDWNSFVTAGLKYRYRHPAFLTHLSSLLDLLYGGPDAPGDLLPLAAMHMMTSSHSLYLPSMLGTGEGSSVDPQSKEALVSLLLTLVRICPSVCDRGHLVVLLGSYGATLAATDQKLLLLLQEYERSGASLVDFQSLLWGPAAVDHHKARKSLGPSLWQQPDCEELLALLQPDRMLRTVERFPRQRRLIPQEGKMLIYGDEGQEDVGQLYDPCFLLPLFSAIVRPEAVVNCLKFVSSHALGVTFAALSSYDPKMTAAAYQVLGSFYQHLEGARFKEKRQLLYLLDMVKNGVRQLNLRVPFIHCAYVARVVQQMLHPEDHMYVVVNRFLLGHQSLDFRRVPEFFKLFYSGDMEHKLERDWMLSVLREGMVDRYCYELCAQQGVFQTLLAFGSSPLCDEATQISILKVVQQVADVPKAAYGLIKTHGLLSWLLQLLEKKRVENRVVCAAIDLLHALWFANLGQKERGRDHGARAGDRKCLPLALINNFLLVLYSATPHLRVAVRAAHLRLFLKTLSSALRHCGTALEVHAQAGWFTLLPRNVSGAEALALLHSWALLARDAALVSALQGVARTFQMKELLGTARQKGGVRGRGQAHVEDPMDATEGHSESSEQDILDDCKADLRSVISHWQPETGVSPGDEPCRFRQAVGHLLIKWALGTLVSSSYEPRVTLCFLKWLQRVALPHEATVHVLLRDTSVRLALLGLYHRACQGDDRAETLAVFTPVMLQLVEAQGRPLGDRHRAVVSSCLSETEEDGSRRESGLLLLSLYVREMWGGADETPELFLSHVRLVASRSPSAAVCRSLLSALTAAAWP